MTSSITAILVSGGGASIVTALIAVFASRSKTKADAASLLIDGARGWATDLREDNKSLRAEIAVLKQSVDEFDDKLDIVISQLMVAIPLIEASGKHSRELVAMRQALERVQS